MPNGPKWNDMFDGEEIVKRGSWMYGGVAPSAIVITRGNVFYGTGDYEDPPDVREDRQIESFQVWFESPPGSGRFPTGGGQFVTLDDAVNDVVDKLADVRWK